VREAGGARINRALTHALGHAPADWRQVCDRISDWLAAPRPGEQHALWTPDHPQYPAALREIPDPPLCLFVRGQCRTVSERCVALVGSRNATRQGLENAKGFAQALAERGWCVVSGLALGIDGAAHQGALASQQAGGTLAVVGTGLDHTYPAQHRLLADEIASRSVLLSELMPGTPPLAFHFPRRNRIIAALSEVVVVVESRESGGSMSTVRQAIERQRDVLAVPGSPRVASSAGTNMLIQQGCGAVTCAADVLSVLSLDHRHTDALGRDERTPPDARGVVVLEACSHGPVTLDQLMLATGWSIAELAVSLGRLEATGWVMEEAGWWEALLLRRGRHAGECIS